MTAHGSGAAFYECVCATPWLGSISDAAADHEPEAHDGDTQKKEENRVPAVREAQKRQHRDECTCKYDERIECHEL